MGYQVQVLRRRKVLEGLDLILEELQVVSFALQRDWERIVGNIG